MLILGIETSCDETSVACVENGTNILSVVTATQISTHEKYGGVVPEIASRLHAETLESVTASALKDAGVKLENIDYIAATNGPGLLGSLLVGITFANALALSKNKRCIGINHLEAHIFSVFMEFSELKPPVIALLVSGGHTVIVKMDDFGKFLTIGHTLDDAAGESFDKISFLLGLGYPGGPVIQNVSRNGDREAFKFPRAMMDHKRKYDFSFSGLKTSVINKVRSINATPENMEMKMKADIAASFQEAVVDVLLHKTISAAEEYKVSTVILAGGVAANSRLRQKMKDAGNSKGINVLWPSLKLCGDNGAMIAGLGFKKTEFAVEHIDDVSAVRNL